jgi:hypothetical protein
MNTKIDPQILLGTRWIYHLPWSRNVFDEPYQCNHIVMKFKVILSNNLKKKYAWKITGFKSLLHENDIVCFVLKGTENLPLTRMQNREKHYFGLSSFFRPEYHWRYLSSRNAHLVHQNWYRISFTLSAKEI